MGLYRPVLSIQLESAYNNHARETESATHRTFLVSKTKFNKYALSCVHKSLSIGNQHLSSAKCFQGFLVANCCLLEGYAARVFKVEDKELNLS
jgi:hypothetical protein